MPKIRVDDRMKDYNRLINRDKDHKAHPELYDETSLGQ